MSEIIYLNGDFLQKTKAKISPDDRGFIFADGVYEVVKYYYGKPFRLEYHLERLKNSLSSLELGFNTEGLAAVFETLLDRNKLTDTHAGVYWQITRGPNNRVHYYPEDSVPTIYAFTFALSSDREKLADGIRVITHEDIRWLRCDIKSISLLPNTMLFNKAAKKGAGECILIRNGMVTEATHSSVLAVRNGKVFTHPLSNLILPGITRQAVKEICLMQNIEFVEKSFSEAELYKMDELLIAGTGSEVTPVTVVDDKVIGSGKPGPLTQFIQDEFFKLT